MAAAPRYITFLHPVDAASVRALLQVVHDAIYKGGVKSIYLLISTAGGSVDDGILLFNTLRALPIELTTHNIGNVDSIGNVIFLAGKTRLANPNATFMWHGVGMNVINPTRYDLKAAIEMVGGLEAATKRMSTTIAACTPLTEEQIHQLFLEASTKDATYAMAMGIIHEIADADIPPGATLIHSPAA